MKNEEIINRNAKYLLYQNDKLFTEISNNLKQFSPVLQKLKKSFEELDMDKFSNEIMTEIKEKGTHALKVEFNRKINAEIKNAGITSTLIRENLLKGSEEKFTAFENAVSDAKRFKPKTSSINPQPTLSFDFVSYQNETKVLNGKFVISEDDKERLLEKYCRIYLQTEEEKNLYVALEEFVKGHDLVRAALHKANFTFTYRQGAQLSEIQDLLFKTDKEGWIEIDPEGIPAVMNRASLIQERQKYSKRNAEYLKRTRVVSTSIE